MTLFPIGSAIYRALLRAFPADVRAERGDEMARQFDDERRACARRPLALAALWLRAAVDALWHGLLERWSVAAPVSERASRTTMTFTDPAASGSTRLRTMTHWPAALVADLRIGARRLRLAPAFTAVAVLTLALGIGANTAIFSVVYGVLLRPLPFPEAERVVGLFHVWEGERTSFSPPNFLDVQARASSFAAMGAYTDARYVLTNAGEPTSVVAGEVSSGFFETLRITPALGRWLQPGENEPGRTRVAVLGHALWRDRFSSDRGIVGKTITLNALPHEVVGVMPAGFRWPDNADLWVPDEYDASYRQTNRAAWIVDVVARLKPGVSSMQAAAEMKTIGAQLEREHPDKNAQVGMTAYPLLDSIVGAAAPGLVILMAAVGFVLLIACANVANLMLARASARADEMAVRVALGAGRRHLVRQLMVESLLLASLGGVAGLGLAYWATGALVALRPTAIPRFGDVGLDGAVIAFTFAATLVAGVLFGLIPAMQVSRRSTSETLREHGRSGLGSRRSQHVRSTLVVVETALAVMLLAASGLLIRSFARLSHVDPGFVVGEAATFSIGLPENPYKTDVNRLVFYDAVREKLRTIPGVTSVGAVLGIPPSAPMMVISTYVIGRPPAPANQEPVSEIRVADEHYFETMGIPIRRGRGFTAVDRPGAPPVALITESGVRRLFPDEDPIGREIEIGWRRGGARVHGTIVGVVADVKSLGLNQPPPTQLYFPLAQVTSGSMAFVVRTTTNAAGLGASIRAAVAAVDRNIPVNRLNTLEQHVHQSIAEQRFYMLLLAIFAGVAVALSAIGIFGVLSYLVAQRTREIGVRIALGAGPRSVVSLVVRQAMLLASVGAAIGLAGGLAVARLLAVLLFDLSPTDPTTFAIAAGALMTMALAASWVPARRASSVDPIVALRGE